MPAATAPAAAPVSAPPAPERSPQEQRRLDARQRQQLAQRTKPLKRELEQAEQRMAQLNGTKAELEARLAAPLPPAEIADAGKRLKSANDELAALEERWLDLSSRIEAIETARQGA